MRKGLALILVVGVLAVLAVLGSAFAVLSRLERRAAHQRVLGTQALLLSRSGVEDAMARLGMNQNPDATENRYGGEDWDLSGGALSALEAPNEVYRPGNPDREACPVSQSMRPSFFERISSGNPVSLDVNGRRRGVSGRLAQGTYALKVIPQAGFFVNDANPQLRRMLGVLAEAVGRDGGLPVAQADGESLVDLRPSSGWATWEQVKTLALGGSQAKFDALRPYLALHAWVDPSVIRPNATTDLIGIRIFRFTDFTLGCPAYQEPATRSAPALEPRAPVSLAWARTRRPALVALLADLRGLYVDETSGPPRLTNDCGEIREARLALDWSAPTDDCRSVADQILAASTSDLSTWQQVNRLFDGLSVSDDGIVQDSPFPDAQLQVARQAKRDLLKAAFNPNTDLNKFNPNRTLWRSVDKQDLLAWSTEFSLEPVHSHEVECVGRVLSSGAKVLASRTMSASMAGPGVLRISTQKDFVCEASGAVRLPGQSPFLTLSQGPPGVRTWGHARAGLGQGLGLQSYPEPVGDPGSGFAQSPAAYDGNLQLATLETPSDEFYSVTATTQDLKMLARYTDTFNLDVADGFDPPLSIATAKTVSRESEMVTATETGRSLLDISTMRANTLYPDGAYCEAGRRPGYPDKGSADGYHGLVSFWIKRRWQGYLNNALPLSESWSAWGHRLLAWTNSYLPPDLDPNDTERLQLFYFGDTTYRGATALFFEIRHGADTGSEYGFKTDPDLNLDWAHRWQLLTFQYDFHSATGRNLGDLILDDGAGVLRKDENNFYGLANGTPWVAEDITYVGASKHYVYLGGRGASEMFEVEYAGGRNPDATVDELAIYDFGGYEWITGTSDVVPASQATLDAPPVFAGNRYKDGRYYKGSVYRPVTSAPVPDEAPSWFSAPLPIPHESVLRQVSWTLIRPAELPDEYAGVELVDTAGTGYLWSGSRSASTDPDCPSWEVRRSLSSACRARVVFLRKTPVDANTPILDSPVLDDLTLLYEPKGGPRLLDFHSDE